MAVLEVILLLAVANGAPILARGIFGDRFTYPLDAGIKLADGRPLFGPSKTLRGLFASVVATGATAEIAEISSWCFGVLVGASAMAGDLISSFIKRRLGLAPSSMARGLDQIPESLLPAWVAAWYLELGAIEVCIIVVLFCVFEITVSPILFRLRIRNTPY